jgi:hypothetical protein
MCHDGSIEVRAAVRVAPVDADPCFTSTKYIVERISFRPNLASGKLGKSVERRAAEAARLGVLARIGFVTGARLLRSATANPQRENPSPDRST